MEKLHNRLTIKDLDNLPENEKGTFGEALAGVYLKAQVRQDPSLFVADVMPTFDVESDSKIWISHISGPTVVQRLCFELASGETISWEPDFSFEITLPEFDRRWRVFIEAKVGSHKPEGTQLAAMELAADQKTPIRTTGLDQPTDPDARLIYFCQISIDKHSISLNYELI